MAAIWHLAVDSFPRCGRVRDRGSCAAEGTSEERAIDAFTYGLRRVELKEELGRVKPTSTAHLMEIDNRWADGEDSLHTNRARSYDDDDADARYTEEPDRRRDRDHRRKRKRHDYDAADGTEMMAAGFAERRDSDNRVTGDRSSGYRTLMIIHRETYERIDSRGFCVQALSSSTDAGRLYVA